jgi:methanogenic corrinoid protein MtbC1
MVEAFQEVYEYLTEKGFKQKHNVMDNQCSRAGQKYIKSTGADIQLVNPDDH